jgi:hypothetical protein
VQSESCKPQGSNVNRERFSVEVRGLLQTTSPEWVQGQNSMTQEMAEAIVKVYNAARELQNLAADGTEETVLKKMMEIRQYCMEGMLGAIK